MTSIFATAAAAAAPGLGGATAGGLGGAGQAAAGAGADKPGTENPRDALVDDGLQQLVNALKERMKANQTALDTFALESSNEPLKMDDKLNTVRTNVGDLKNQLRVLDRQLTSISEKSKVDRSIANQASIRQEQLTKNAKFGLQQSVHYMDSMVDSYEETISSHHTSLSNVEAFVKSRLDALDGDAKEANTESALQQHCTRFEGLFRRTASKIYENDDKMKRIKADFVGTRKKKYGQYAKDPFKSSAHRVDNKENLPLLKADQTFPSQNTLMRIGQSVPKAAPAAGPTVGFGGTTGTAGGTLFGAAKPAIAPFSFNTATPAAAASTSGSLFNKPFGATATTTTASSSLFGATTSTAPTTTTPSAFPLFSNTLNSSVSGTLFGGSASKPFGK